MSATIMGREPFAPAFRRSTSVVLTKNASGNDYRLIISVCTRKTTEIVRINVTTGLLEQENDRVCESTYDNEAEALDVLKQAGYEVVERGHALLGYACVGATAGVLLATRVREKGTLPGGHTVQLVTDSQWVLVTLRRDEQFDPSGGAMSAAGPAGTAPPGVRQDQDFWRAVQQFTLNNAHFYCETADISRPFPSAEDAANPSPEFVWNSWLRQPLVDMGLFAHCPPLLQGAVESAAEVHPVTGQRFSMALISRRSRRHPGTRYIARGLNDSAGPGNEIESELVVWTHPTDAPGGAAGAGHRLQEPLRWSRVVWRRGTVPIWWGVQLQSLQKGLQAEVYVRSEHPYLGTASYFRSVQRQHVPRPRLAWPDQQQQGAASSLPAASGAGAGAADGLDGGAAAAPEDLSTEVPITCINLLHCNPKKAAELMLSSHFQESMRHVRRKLGADAPIRVVNFDWHGNMGNLTEEKAVEGFWAFMEGFLRSTGLASGTMEPTPEAVAQRRAAVLAQQAQQAPWAQQQRQVPQREQQPATSQGAAIGGSGSSEDDGCSTPWGSGWRMRWSSQQNGVLRINCADSLDRTNAASCFGMLPALQEALRQIGVQLDVGSTAAGSAAVMRSRQGTASGGGMGSSYGSTQDLAAAGDAQLPPGWEVRPHAGRLLYIDHVNKRTQWDPPSSHGSSLSGRPQPALQGDGQGAATPPRHPSSSGRLMQSAAELLGRMQRGSPPRGAEQQQGGGLAVHRSQRSFGSSGQLTAGQGGDRGSPEAPLPTQLVPLSPLSSSAAQQPGPEGGGPAAEQAPSQPWAFFQLSLQDVRDRLLKDAVADYVEMFKVHGDIHSFLYTGSPAMHSHVLSLVVQSRQGYGATSSVGKLQNLRVAVQRRWNNTVSDTSRQQAIELFLGLNLQRHFPGLPALFDDRTVADLRQLEPVDLAELAAPGVSGLGAGAGEHAPAAGELAVGTGEEEGEDDHAMAVPGVDAREHDGVLGVPMNLIDLEPLGEGAGARGSPASAGRGLPHSSSDSAVQHAVSRGTGSSSSSTGSEASTPASLQRPVEHPLAGLGDSGLGSSTSSSSTAVHRQLQDLML